MKLNLRNNFVLVKNNLTKRNVESPSLEDVKNYLDQVLSGLMPFLLTPGLFSTFFWYDCDHHERYGKSEYVTAVHNRNGATSKFNRKSNSASSSGTKSKESKPLGQKIWTEKKKKSWYIHRKWIFKAFYKETLVKSFSQKFENHWHLVCNGLLREESLWKRYAIYLYCIFLTVITDTTEHWAQWTTGLTQSGDIITKYFPGNILALHKDSGVYFHIWNTF